MDSQKFESVIYGNNMIPLISLATHFKPGCNPSLIDNILTNSSENIHYNQQVFLRVVFHTIIQFFALSKMKLPKLKIHPIETQNMTIVNQT